MKWITKKELKPFRSALEAVQKDGHQTASITKCASAIDAQTGVAREDLVGDMEVADVLADPEFLETIRAKYGNGVYTVKLWKKDLFLHFEAGSDEAAYAFIALLRSGSEGVIAYAETHTVSYEEVEMEEVTGTERGRGISTNRVELIHMITNLIESSDLTVIEDRDDMAMLAIHIVDGLEDEADRLAEREIGISSDKTLLVCPECGASFDKPAFWSELADHSLITCEMCEHVAGIGEFRTATAGDGGEE